MKRLSRWLREPLLHFFLLGLLLFVAYSWVSKEDEGTERDIVVSQGQIQNLAEIFSRTWQRPPSPEELQGLIHEFIRDEIYYREGLRLGLDQDDIIVKRRIRQKMEFVSEEASTRTEPSEAQLEKFLGENENKFRSEPKISFRHIYFNPDRRGAKTREEALSLLEKLQEGSTRADALNLGDTTLLKSQYQDLSSGEAAGIFGEDFAKQLLQAPLKQWSGPLPSGYGFHLLFVEAREDGRLPQLEEIRETVAREWNYTTQQAERERHYQDLLRNYKIKIEPIPVSINAKSGAEKS